jgi:hypothetical protein
MAFLYLVPTGMNDPTEPTWGSWAGDTGRTSRASGKPYFWANQTDTWRGTTNRDNTLARWAADLQNDFRARMDWCVKPRAEANHRPSRGAEWPQRRGILRLEAKPGSVVELDAQGSSDPDGDAITCEWFVYGEAGTYRARNLTERGQRLDDPFHRAGGETSRNRPRHSAAERRWRPAALRGR